MARKSLLNSGYAVEAKKTGAQYPNYAHALGIGWEFILTCPDGKEYSFSSHEMAWVFAERIARQVA